MSCWAPESLLPVTVGLNLGQRADTYASEGVGLAVGLLDLLLDEAIIAEAAEVALVASRCLEDRDLDLIVPYLLLDSASYDLDRRVRAWDGESLALTQIVSRRMRPRRAASSSDSPCSRMALV